ncbi:MAG: LamG domain-containing protein [Mesorhizobium sp.]|uniref:LamG domain-containing protein n=1 Tax=Mesorhizobium sp. TaxID=1871066 RepID=UPI00121D43C5|nr:LamG domain-containing protein [Mesorhizobium sp.]TIO52975.1 MAG: LamG domain-containing protein [Mesorhizobium sp.]TIO61808.1 MAG: LamG domain-containing protein [Mesorhizobium sp.]TJV66737.1 MAG: LamG domain-containing protein [Mesorhizobium sp.]
MSMMVSPYSFAAAGGGGGSDPYFSSVKLLLGFEGANGATSTTDESPSAHSFTFNGDAQIDTAQFKFGASSCLFDTSGDYLSSADSLDWRLAASNSDTYTIEFWIRPHSNVNGVPIMGQAPGSTNFAWYLDLTITATPSYAITFNTSANGSSFSTVGIGPNTLPLDTWHYIAVSKNSSGKIRTWVNGNFGSSITPADSSIFNSTGAFEIGRSFFTTGLNAWLDEIRITKGVCRYDTDGSIAVPTAAFPRS